MSSTDLSGLHNTMRIQRTLDLLHQIYSPFAQLFIQVLLADPDPVLTGACDDL
jgi:hypothetical protein